MEMVIKMNRKHKINLWLVFFVVALFVVSTGMSAMGNIVSNDVEKENNEKNVITMNTDVTLDCGVIMVYGYPGDYPSVDYYCSATGHSNVDVGTGCAVTVEVRYDLWAKGDDDKATARIWFTDKPSEKATFTTPNNNDRQSGKLSLTRHMEDASSYSLKLEVEWRDFISYNNILVGDKTPSDTSTITTKVLKPELGVSGKYLTAKVKAGQTGSVSFTVKNTGDEGSLLNWGIKDEFGSCADEWSISPKGGNNLETENTIGVTITYTMPALPIRQKYNNNKLTVYNTDDSTNNVWVYVTFKTPGYDKSKSLPLHNIIQARFPQLFTLLQRLPAFQQ